MKKILTSIAFVIASCASFASQATTITFNSGLDPFFTYEEVLVIGRYSPGSGYDKMADYTNDNGFAVLNPFEASPSTFNAAENFTLNSFLLAGAWGAQTLTINGLLNGATLYTKQVRVSTNPQLVTFDWSGITAFMISTGTDFEQDATLIPTGQHWVLDNVVVNEDTAAVPEPQTIALLAFGMLGLTAARRKKAKR